MHAQCATTTQINVLTSAQCSWYTLYATSCASAHRAVDQAAITLSGCGSGRI